MALSDILFPKILIFSILSLPLNAFILWVLIKYVFKLQKNKFTSSLKVAIISQVFIFLIVEFSLFILSLFPLVDNMGGINNFYGYFINSLIGPIIRTLIVLIITPILTFVVNVFLIKNLYQQSTGKSIVISISWVILFFVIIALLYSVQSLFKPESGSYIISQIKQANYCNVKEDCIDAGSKCPFGCHIYVNKDKVDKISRLLKSYSDKCNYDFQCLDCPDVECDNNKCRRICVKPKLN